LTDSKTILKYLPSYRGNIEIITNNQDVKDIMKAMQNFHTTYASDYDKIYKFFLGKTPEQTAQNLFDFLKKNCSYYIEGLEGQTVRNPSAILATGKLDGIDCKNYALFIGGVLDAINRSGKQTIPFAYRYAQTDLFDENYNHVFIVIFPKTQHELFIDPIPEVKNLDDRFPIYSYTDKKLNTMLYGVSGTKNQIGFTIPGIGVNTDDIASVANILLPLFYGKENPNDWKGWAAQDASYGEKTGFSAASWTMKDGDSVKNEALNIVQWIRQYGLPTILQFHKGINATPTIQDIVNKLTRGGFGTEAQQFLTAYNRTGSMSNTSQLPALNTQVSMPVMQDNNGRYWDAQNKEVTNNADGSFMVKSNSPMMAGMNMYVTLALVGAGIYAVTKM